MATTATKAAFARRHKVNRSTVNKWEARGHLVMTVDGLVNVEASDALLTKRPVAYRGGTAKGPVAAAPPSSSAGAKLASASPLSASSSLDPPAQSDPSEVVIAALSTIVREIGACAARRAVEFGASLQTAYALDTAVCVEAGAIGERFLASIGTPLAASWSLVEVADVHHGGIVPANWPALAEAASEPLDLPALEDWFSRLPNFDPTKEAAHG